MLRACGISGIVIRTKEFCTEIGKLKFHQSHCVFTCHVTMLTFARTSNVTLRKLVYIIHISQAFGSGRAVPFLEWLNSFRPNVFSPFSLSVEICEKT
jgi:hypothetical protein